LGGGEYHFHWHSLASRETYLIAFNSFSPLQSLAPLPAMNHHVSSTGEWGISSKDDESLIFPLLPSAPPFFGKQIEIPPFAVAFLAPPSVFCFYSVNP